MVGHDVAGVNRAGAIELPGEVHTHAACGLLHLLEVVLLLFAFELAFRGHQMHGHFLLRGLVLDHGLQKFHEVAHLVEQAVVRIGDGDRGRALDVGAEQRIEGEALLVLLECEVLFLEDGLGRGLGLGPTLGRVRLRSFQDFPIFTLGNGLVVVAGVFLLFERGDQLGLGIRVLIGKADVAVGGVDAHQLIFDALAAFNREAQQFLDLFLGCLTMRKENLRNCSAPP